MNAHVPQTPEARAEVQELLHVPKHLIHPRANKPMMGIIQDGLDAGYFLTQQSALFNRIDAMGLLMTVRYSRLASDTIRLGEPGAEMVCPKLPPPAILFPEERWTGSQLVSQTIPNINMERKVKNRPAPIDSDPLVASDGVLLICNGEILRGSLCKQSLGATAGGIIHMICTYCGNNVAARFMSDVQRMLNKYLTTQGFSIGLDDCRSDSEVQRKVRIVMETTEKHVAYIESLAEEMPNDPQVRQLAEEKTQETLTSMLTMIGNLVRAHLGPSNMFNIMSNIVGSKGSVFNMAQVRWYSLELVVAFIGVCFFGVDCFLICPVCRSWDWWVKHLSTGNVLRLLGRPASCPMLLFPDKNRCLLNGVFGSVGLFNGRTRWGCRCPRRFCTTWEVAKGWWTRPPKRHVPVTLNADW